MPAFDEEHKEEHVDFYHAIEKVTFPHHNNKKTSDFLTLGLTLKNSKLIYYGIDKKDGITQIMPYIWFWVRLLYVQWNTGLLYTGELFERNHKRGGLSKIWVKAEIPP